MTKAEIHSQNVIILNNIETELRKKMKNSNSKLKKFEICLPVLKSNQTVGLPEN